MIFASCVIIAAIVDHKPNNLPVSAIARFDGGLFTAMSLISVAFTMHYNAQRYYQELVDRSLQRIGRIIFGSFTFAFFLYAFVGIFGVLEFDDAVQSNVINNFLPSPLINTTRVFLSLAIIASFPLPFHGCRSNFLRLFFRLEGDDLPTSRWVTAPLPLHSQPHSGTEKLIINAFTSSRACHINGINIFALLTPARRSFLPSPFSFPSSASPSLPTMWVSSSASRAPACPPSWSTSFQAWPISASCSPRVSVNVSDPGCLSFMEQVCVACLVFLSFTGLRSALVKMSFLSP
jgi:hypothetical protein